MAAGTFPTRRRSPQLRNWSAVAEELQQHRRVDDGTERLDFLKARRSKQPSGKAGPLSPQEAFQNFTSPKQTVALKIDGVVYAKISVRPKGLVLAICDGRGMHLSITRKSDSAFHVEVSSDQPLGSVWDEARIGIARSLGWARAERHANYIVNREYPIPPWNDPLSLVSFGRPRELPPQKEKYLCLPSLDLRTDGRWDYLSVSLLFSGTFSTTYGVVFPLDWASLLLSAEQRNQR
jgi:hypothetical protein